MTLSGAPIPAVARGHLIFDDGISPINTDTNQYADFEFFMVKNVGGTTFTMTITNVGKLTKPATPALD